jgi:hypothetical protein
MYISIVMSSPAHNHLPIRYLCTNRNLLLYFIAPENDHPRLEMLIRVQYQNNLYGIVDVPTLDWLLLRKNLRQFYRPSEQRWVDVDRDPVRGLGGDYSGPDRRQPNMTTKE